MYNKEKKNKSIKYIFYKGLFPINLNFNFSNHGGKNAE